MGRVIRATFINVKGDAVEKIQALAQEVCCSEEHNLIIEELTAWVMPPKKETT